MRKLLFALFVGVFLIIALPESAQAQIGADYKTSVGVRLSPWYGVSAKHFMSSSDALEGILNSRWDALKITGLYERHALAFDEPGLKFYYGGGAHVGFFGTRYGNYWGPVDYRGHGGAILGLDGILGIEYTIQDQEIPLNVSLDWKPVFDLVPWPGFRGVEVAVTVRYIFRYY